MYIQSTAKESAALSCGTFFFIKLYKLKNICQQYYKEIYESILGKVAW